MEALVQILISGLGAQGLRQKFAEPTLQHRVDKANLAGKPSPGQREMRGQTTLSRSKTLLRFILSALVFLNNTDAESARPFRIVTSTADLASLAREIGGDRVVVKYLANGDQDPHFVPDNTSSLEKLNHAGLLMVIGLQMESFWLGEEGLLQPSLLSQCGNLRIQFGTSGYFDLSRYVEVLDVPNELTRAQGIHPLGNPHYWLDPENGRRIARAIAAKLGTELPSDSQYCQQRLLRFEARLTAKEREWDERLRPYRGYKVITYHRAWINF